MKPEQKAAKSEGHDFVDSFVSQTTRKELFLSLSCNRDSPIHLVQLLNALNQQGTNKSSNSSNIENGRGRNFLDHHSGTNLLASDINGTKGAINSVKRNDIPKVLNNALCQAAVKGNSETEKYLSGWPMLPPSKITMQKCEKCSQEFCSPINYRRHIRIHRRSLNINKVSPKSRENLCSFIDKLSLDEQKELFSFNNVSLEEVTGTSIINALISLIQRQWFSSLPQVYVKAGATLLDILHANPSRFPISSQTILSILDDASEKTFLCAGNAASLQKFMFDGEVEKIALDVKNVVACASFLLEQKLFKALLDDKDTEALRCQQLLEEEEKAAQKRQAELLERKKQKKLRQKEQKAKKTCVGNKDGSFGTPSELLPYTESVGTPGETLDACGLQSEHGDLAIDDHSQCEIDQRKASVSQIISKSRGILNGFQAIQTTMNYMAKKRPVKELKFASSTNNQMVWTRKTKPEMEGIDINGETTKQVSYQTDNSEILIGSMTVSIQNHNANCGLLDNITTERTGKHDVIPNSGSQPTAKRWRPVSQQGGTDPLTVQYWQEIEFDGILNEATSLITPAEKKSLDSSTIQNFEQTEVNSFLNEITSPTTPTEKKSFDPLTVQNCEEREFDGPLEEVTNPTPTEKNSLNHTCAPQPFYTEMAEDFLVQRWKTALASDDVKIVPSPTTQHCDCINFPEGSGCNHHNSTANSFYKPKINDKDKSQSDLYSKAEWF